MKLCRSLCPCGIWVGSPPWGVEPWPVVYYVVIISRSLQTPVRRSSVRASEPASSFPVLSVQLVSMNDAASPPKPVSELLIGQNILRQAQGSVFGQFHTAYANLKDDSDQFSLPRVIVIGEKNQGKSSLLENITSVPSFPETWVSAQRCQSG